jgi:predicted nucleic acid-binding protein
MGKYVVDDGVVLHILSEKLELASQHKLLAPTLIRSQVLDSLYQDVRNARLSEAEGRERLARFSVMKIRFLGDKVLRRRAWEVADQLGWDSTEKAEYIALTQLQADAFVTLDDKLARSVEGIVVVEPLDILF